MLVFYVLGGESGIEPQTILQSLSKAAELQKEISNV